jgi:hypothetical protein
MFRQGYIIDDKWFIPVFGLTRFCRALRVKKDKPDRGVFEGNGSLARLPTLAAMRLRRRWGTRP